MYKLRSVCAVAAGCILRALILLFAGSTLQNIYICIVLVDVCLTLLSIVKYLCVVFVLFVLYLYCKVVFLVPV